MNGTAMLERNVYVATTATSTAASTATPIATIPAATPSTTLSQISNPTTDHSNANSISGAARSTIHPAAHPLVATLSTMTDEFQRELKGITKSDGAAGLRSHVRSSLRSYIEKLEDFYWRTS